MATLQEICNDAADIIGIQRPTSVIAGNDQTARTLLACAQREGKDLAQRWAWQRITRQHTFTSTATTIQATGLPTDWADQMVADTFFNRSMHRPVGGPLNSLEWQTYLAMTAPVVTDAFRIQEGNLELLPTPSAGWTYAYEYVSKNWCASAVGTAQSAWAADDDVALLDDEAMKLGVIWRFLKSRGMDYAEDFTSYERKVQGLMARDGARRTVDLRGYIDYGRRPRYPAVPEGSWVV